MSNTASKIVSIGELESDLRKSIIQDVRVEMVSLRGRSVRRICYKHYANCAKGSVGVPLLYLTPEVYEKLLQELKGSITKKMCEGVWHIMHFEGDGSVCGESIHYAFDEMYFIKEIANGKYYVIEAYIRHDSNVNWTDCFMNHDLLFECFPKIVKDKFDGIQVEAGAIVLQPSRIVIIDS